MTRAKAADANSTKPKSRRRKRPRIAKGLPWIGTRIRRFIWSWWVWILAAATWRHWGLFATFLIVAFLAFLFAPPEQSPTYGLDHDFATDSDQFLSTMTGATDTPSTSGNTIDIYNNGDEFYPVMLEEIDKAERTITMEAYIYWGGEIGRRFADKLAEKSKEGITVKLLLDSVGSSTISDEILDILEGSGCQIAWYHPIQWYTLKRLNNRTHRKSLIIDGKIGFTGGAGIADHWQGNAQNPEHWRDMQIRIHGPAVRTLQAAFAQNWLETTNELVSGPDYYPNFDGTDGYETISILSSPESGASTVRIMYYLSIVCARKSIIIANPYFVPDEAAIETLVDAKKRGVDVKIVVSGEHNDNALARYNSTALYGPLLEAGIEIYEYNRTMLHHKIMVIDGIWSTIGTANFDNRSFALNDENNVCVYNETFATELTADFMSDLQVSDRVTLENWRKRSIFQKGFEIVASMLKEQV